MAVQEDTSDVRDQSATLNLVGMFAGLYGGEKRLVILESPYASKLAKNSYGWHQEIEQNVLYARAALRHSLLCGEAPIASHLLYTQPGVLDDTIPDERQLGIDAGLAWRRVASGSVVYLDRGVSSGMQYGIKLALEANKPVDFRSLTGDQEVIDFWKNAIFQ